MNEDIIISIWGQKFYDECLSDAIGIFGEDLKINHILVVAIGKIANEADPITKGIMARQ